MTRWLFAVLVGLALAVGGTAHVHVAEAGPTGAVDGRRQLGLATEHTGAVELVDGVAHQLAE